MRIGELLVAAGLVSPEQITTAMLRQARDGGRLGPSLIATGAIDAASLDAFLGEVPAEPTTLAESGIAEKFLLDLLLKHLLASTAETVTDLAAALRLLPKLVGDLMEVAQRTQLLAALGGTGLSLRYELTDVGRNRAHDALTRSAYVGPAPVTIADYSHWVRRQKLTNESIDWPRVAAAFADLQVPDAFIDQIGPAVSSGRAILLHGPPGNGKTSVAQRLQRVFRQIIYIPHAVLVDGQVMRVFDPDVHRPVVPAAAPDISLYRDAADGRWIACWRPFIIVGGELTLDMLDLKHEPGANFYTAPLHVKAAGGCLLIDDFGRQLVSPTALLNRWIVPLESRVDYLRLHTGQSFAVPFESVVIFSTNLAPAALMDPAFLRRIPYKLEVPAPTRDTWRRIFAAVAVGRGLGDRVDDAVTDAIIAQLHVAGVELAAFQPGFLIDQIVAACRFRGIPMDFHAAMVEQAIGNLTIGGGAAAPTLARVA